METFARPYDIGPEWFVRSPLVVGTNYKSVTIVNIIEQFEHSDNRIGNMVSYINGGIQAKGI